jgi:hypothetical protein
MSHSPASLPNQATGRLRRHSMHRVSQPTRSMRPVWQPSANLPLHWTAPQLSLGASGRCLVRGDMGRACRWLRLSLHRREARTRLRTWHHQTRANANLGPLGCDSPALPRGNPPPRQNVRRYLVRRDGVREMRSSKGLPPLSSAPCRLQGTRAAGNIRWHLIIDGTKVLTEANDYTDGANKHFPG